MFKSKISRDCCVVANGNYDYDVQIYGTNRSGRGSLRQTWA